MAPTAVQERIRKNTIHKNLRQPSKPSPVVKANALSRDDRIKLEAYGMMEFYINPLFQTFEQQFPGQSVEVRLSFTPGTTFEVYTEPYVSTLHMKAFIPEVSLFVSALNELCEIAPRYGIQMDKVDAGMAYWRFTKLS